MEIKIIFYKENLHNQISMNDSKRKYYLDSQVFYNILLFILRDSIYLFN